MGIFAKGTLCVQKQKSFKKYRLDFITLLGQIIKAFIFPEMIVTFPGISSAAPAGSRYMAIVMAE